MQVAGLMVSTVESAVPFKSGLKTMHDVDGLEEEIQRVAKDAGVHDLLDHGICTCVVCARYCCRIIYRTYSHQPGQIIPAPNMPRLISRACSCVKPPNQHIPTLIT